MLAWLWNLIIGQLCCHKWKIIETRRVSMDGEETHTRYYLQCENCGNMKFKG